MLGSLRFRLPALFLLGVVLAGLVTTLVAVRLFTQFAHNQTLNGLRAEAAGISELYANAVQADF
ncbi:MAG: hypothetical protein JOY72_04015, partial [Actinobacteria bacterium]|nr:hypothetical protein [Actinomycetota bacterium]